MENETPVFSQLDADGQFHRDSVFGRMFHPGTRSYREISARDSVHIAVTPENRVSVHVDSVSPLSVDHDHGSRYSLGRVLAHIAAHCREAVGRLWQRRAGDNRCDLDCEGGDVTSTIEADGATTYRFSCRAAGIYGCRWKTTADSEEELLAQVTDHVRTVHHVDAATRTVAARAIQLSRPT